MSPADAARTGLVPFWSGRIVSGGAGALTALAIPFILAVTLHLKPAEVGLVLAGAFVAVLLSPLYAGVVVDRFDRRAVAVVSDLGRFVTLLGFAVVPLVDGAHVLVLLVLNTLLAAFETTATAVLFAGFPDIIGEENLESGQARLQTLDTVADTAGAAVGGVLLTVLGPVVVFLSNAVGYLFSAVTLRATRWPGSKVGHASAAEDPSTYWSRVISGFRVMRTHPSVALLALTSAAANFFICASAVALLWQLVRHLEMSFLWYSIILGVGSLGAVVGAAAVRRVGAIVGSELRVQAIAVLVYGLMLGAYASIFESTAVTIVIACLIDFVIGFAISLYVVNNAVQLQRRTPAEHRGALAAARSTLTGVAAAGGTAVAGASITAFGAQASIALCGVGLLGVGIAVLVALRGGRDRSDRGSGTPDHEDADARLDDEL